MVVCSCCVDIPLFGVLGEGVGAKGAKGEKDENKSEEVARKLPIETYSHVPEREASR